MTNGDSDHSKPDAGNGDDRRRPPSGDDATTLPTPSDPAIDSQIGPYRLLEHLGEGGMGEVYLAEQKTPIKRKVALKLIKVGMDTKEVIARFESERQALAMMNHPHVARIFDAGSTDTGRPYFVMEHVPGEPITTYCDRHKLDLRSRLELFIPVCQAIHHAHQKGIIHRDIKPSNVLVAVEDGRPVSKVIDFGVAKATQQALTEKTLYTLQGKLVGTPAYMSPEQAEMTGLNVDTTSDVYSLGVLLYELLVGAQPFDAKELREAGIAEIHRIIREVEPPKPSTRISSYGEEATRRAARRKVEPNRWRKQLQGELDWITMRAMDKDRTLRYQSASELEADLNRYLNSEAVVAGPPSIRYRLGKSIRKHRGPFVAGLVVVFALALGALTSTILYLRSEEARKESQRLHTETVRQAYVANMLAAQAALSTDDAVEAKMFLTAADSTLRGWEWRHLKLMTDQSVAAIALDGWGSNMDLSPDGRQLAVATSGQSVQIIDVASRRIVRSLTGHTGWVTAVEYSPDGTRICSMSGDGMLIVWDAATHRMIYSFPGHGENGAQFTFLRGGDRILAFVGVPRPGFTDSSAPDSRLRVWNIVTGEDEYTEFLPDLHVTTRVAISADGHWAVVGTEHGEIIVWDVDDFRREATLDIGHQLLSVACSPQGFEILYAGLRGRLGIWNPTTGLHKTFDGPEWQQFGELSFSPDGSQFLAGTLNNTVSIRDARSGELIRDILGHESYVGAFAYLPDEGTFATASFDETVRIWDLERLSPQRRLSTRGSAPLAFNPSGRRLAGGSIPSYLDLEIESDHALRIWDVSGSDEALELPGHTDRITCLDWSPDGTHIASGSADGTARIWDVEKGDPIHVLSHPDAGVTDVVFSRDGLALASAAGDITIWDSATGDQIRKLEGEDGQAQFLSFSPDGSHLAVAFSYGKISIWNYRTGQHLKSWDSGCFWRCLISHSPDGAVIASACSKLDLWSASTGDHIRTIGSQDQRYSSVAWSPDGSRLVTTDRHGEIRIWDPDRGDCLLRLDSPGRSAQAAVFSPDGQRIAVGGKNVEILNTNESP